MLKRIAFILLSLVYFNKLFSQEYPSILARVNNEVITYNEVKRIAEGSNLPYEKIINQLIDRQLLIDAFEAQKGKVQVSHIDLQMDTLIQNNFNGNRQQFIAILQAEGQSIYELKDEIKNSIIENVMRQQNFRSSQVLSPKKIQTYYQNHLEQFLKPARYYIKQSGFKADATISINNESLLKKDYLETLLQQNVEFSTIKLTLDEFSTEAIWYTASELDPQLAIQLANLPLNQNTPYIKINEVYATSYLLQKESATLLPLSEVQKEIEEVLLFEVNTQAYKNYIQNLRNKAFIQIFYKN